MGEQEWMVVKGLETGKAMDLVAPPRGHPGAGRRWRKCLISCKGLHEASLHRFLYEIREQLIEEQMLP